MCDLYVRVHKNDSIVAVPEYEVVHIHRVRKRSIASNSYNQVETLKDRGPNYKHRRTKEPGRPAETLKFRAFGKPLNLSLVRNEGLFRRGLKIWTVEPNATSQHGVEYIEIPQVRYSLCVIIDFKLKPSSILS